MAYFDADWFLANVTAHQCSWYYASPTIHQSILDAFHRKPVPHRLRLIANAAAPLPPTLAVKMRETYSAPGRRCVLMPSYGMTECMPISAPPHDYNLERPGSSGRQLGPQLEIHTAEGVELPRGQVGHIALKGPPVMQGYEGGDGSEFIKGWFHTGDNGYIDDEGNLFVVARTKEAINRGGETIIPAEVEAALLTHPAIKSICCFATPHATLQETVGCMVVPAFGYSRITLNQLTKHASQYLHSSKWPAVLVYGTAMPLNATGKLVRVKLAERMSIATVDDETPEGERVYEMLGTPSKVPQEPIPVKPVVVKAPAKGSEDWVEPFTSAHPPPVCLGLGHGRPTKQRAAFACTTGDSRDRGGSERRLFDAHPFGGASLPARPRPCAKGAPCVRPAAAVRARGRTLARKIYGRVERGNLRQERCIVGKRRVGEFLNREER